MKHSIKVAKLLHWLHMAQALVLLLPVVFIGSTARAATLLERSIRLNTPVPSAVTTHNIKFTIATPATLGSVLIQYCSNNPFFNFSCTAPDGLSLSSANLSSQSGETGFSIGSGSNANTLLLTRSPSLSGNGEVSFSFDNVTNPSAEGSSTYVRVSTYPTTDASGPRTDQGAMVFSVQGNFTVGGFVPPFLNLCVGIQVTGDCTAFSGEQGNLGILNATRTASMNSQFAVATNDLNGYFVYSLGNTLTSGNNVIPAASSPTAVSPGRSKFGLNLRNNTSPDIGSDVTGNGVGTPLSNYASPNLYMFNSGDAIASSPNSTDYSLFTVSYVTDISNDQPAGVYTTTITYLAAAQF